MIRATKGNLKDVIIDAIEQAAEEYFHKSGLHIRKAPEYFMNIHIVQKICGMFDQVGYRLEMQVKDMLQMLGIESSISPDEIRENGKFDIVLLSRSNFQPRHVIEVKRSLSRRQLLKEAKRIKTLALEDHYNKRLQTGFIATISRVKSSMRSLDCKSLLDNRLHLLSTELGNQFKVSCRYKLMDNGDYGFDNTEALLVSVFELQKS